jgi:hypothetical protein
MLPLVMVRVSPAVLVSVASPSPVMVIEGAFWSISAAEAEMLAQSRRPH